ncbi:phosphoinositide 3-kinase adapter protein 1 isoform X1 [Tribolium castaneum]|uniref:phosphoinositide 3-kinase adapter protein 1 isoform X1 n=1 Tax=Tribolium castaneum TaxID=7070 RepID=UPI0030FF3765
MDLDNPSYFSVAAEAPKRAQKMDDKNKRSLRSFLRSVSSNSADSNQELLIMGEPRLSDIDPDLAFKHQASRSNSLRTREHQDLLYNLLPTSEEAELSGDEVFLGEETATYYNCSPSKRRHSIGTFISRERSTSVASSSRSFKDDFPLAIVHATSAGDSPIFDDHALRHASYPRKRCPRCTRAPVKKPANMDDILIVSFKGSEAADLWAEYFTNYFQQLSKANKKPFKIQHMLLEDCISEPKEDPKIIAERATNVKLQLVILCPNFLDFVAEYPDKCSELGKLLLADRTLALLLGVSDSDLTEVHKKTFPTYFQWQRLGVGQDQDENFTKEFLGHAMSILSRIWKQQTSVTQEKSYFSVSPKKIRQGQNSVFILLTYPLQKEDILKVSIERNNEIFEVKTVKRRNPYTIKISVPNNLTEVTAIVNILVEKNGSIVGSRPIKCESRLRELEQILRLTNNPIEFMCQTLGFNPSSREQLDNWLLQAFQRNLPAHFNLLANHDTPFGASVQLHKHSHEEHPTLLHFAAKFGFEKLALQLLDCPGADVAFDIKNIHDMTPSEIAETNGHPELAATLRGYMNMNEFTHMYSKLKEMSLNSAKIDEDSYITPKEIEELYKICPAPRPVFFGDSLNSPSSECGYMSMTPPVKIIIEHSEPAKSPTPSIKTDAPSSLPPNEITEDKVQKELLEIINDFKNNVHSISQVEKLVEEWKNRNDVQKSFKEKQEQLKEMRLKYEKIQQEMKASMKKPTPFERVRKLFGRSKSKEEKHEISSPVLASPSIVAIQTQRPISSLSTSSSGSSGRMSTISGCSLGDSGTHSDNEERKNMLGSHNEEDFRNVFNKAALELNYTPVPAPKPVKTGIFSNRNQLFETIEEKPIARPDSLPVGEEYYIQFPRSGLPVAGVEEKAGQEYMNVGAAKDEETHEYMNFKVMTKR